MAFNNLTFSIHALQKFQADKSVVDELNCKINQALDVPYVRIGDLNEDGFVKLTKDEFEFMLKNSSRQIPDEQVPVSRRMLGCEYHLVYSFMDGYYGSLIIAIIRRDAEISPGVFGDVVKTLFPTKAYKFGASRAFGREVKSACADAIGFCPARYTWSEETGLLYYYKPGNTTDAELPSPSKIKVSCLYNANGDPRQVKTRRLFAVNAAEYDFDVIQFSESPEFKDTLMAVLGDLGIKSYDVTSVIVALGNRSDSKHIITDLDSELN